MKEKTIRLERGLTVLIRGNAAALLCVTGKLWVTSSGDGRDFLATNGRMLDLRNRTGICVQALEDAEFTLLTGAALMVAGGFDKAQ